MCMFCRSLFVLVFFFFWPFCFLSFFDLRILINPLVYSNSFHQERKFGPFYWSTCSKPAEWGVTTFMCAMSIDVASDTTIFLLALWTGLTVIFLFYFIMKVEKKNLNFNNPLIITRTTNVNSWYSIMIFIPRRCLRNRMMKNKILQQTWWLHFSSSAADTKATQTSHKHHILRRSGWIEWNIYIYMWLS